MFGACLIAVFCCALLDTGSRGDNATKRYKASEHKKKVENENTYAQQALTKVRNKYTGRVPGEKFQYSAVTLRNLKDITGLKLHTPASRRQLSRHSLSPARPLRAGEQLPASFDLRKEIQKWAPDQNLQVHDQGNCGCCWAFAAVGAYEGNYLYKQLGRGPGVSEQYILSCTDNGCDGAQTTTGLDFLLQKGAPTRDNVPYVGYGEDCSGEGPPKNQLLYFASDSALVGTMDPNSGTVSDNELKAAVFKHGAIVVGYYASDAFMSPSISTEDEVYQIDESGNPPNHAIVLIGWNDNKLGPGQGAWLIKNSWTTRWGAGGYMWIKYGINGLGTDAAWIEAKASPAAPPSVGPVVPPPGPGPAPTPAPGPAPVLPPIVIPPNDPEVDQMSQSIRSRLDWYRQNYPSLVGGTR
jgi:C1A family cysteine protease